MLVNWYVVYDIMREYVSVEYTLQLSLQSSVSQPQGRGPVQGPGINYTGPQGVLLEFVILVF